MEKGLYFKKLAGHEVLSKWLPLGLLYLNWEAVISVGMAGRKVL